jgi:L-aspartate oxidase
LLEAAVFGARAGRAAAAEAEAPAGPLTAILPPELPTEALAALRAAMSRDAGVVRDAAGLTRLIRTLDALEAAHGRSAPLVAARFIAMAALGRSESRGGHFRADATAETAPRRTFMSLADLDAPRRSAAA